jgi:hypothetical protein
VKTHTHKLIWIAAAGLTLTLVWMMVRLLGGSGGDAGTAGQSWAQQNILEYEATLAVSTDAQERAFLQDKLDRLYQMEANRIAGLQNATEKTGSICDLLPTLDPATPTARVSRILSGVNVPVNPEEFSPQNGWQGELGGVWVRVYAGALTENPAQGLLWVIFDNNPEFGSYVAAGDGGALKITAEQGGRLTLQNARGDTLWFDLNARRYLSSEYETAAAVTPLPTFTPTIDPCQP